MSFSDTELKNIEALKAQAGHARDNFIKLLLNADNVSNQKLIDVLEKNIIVAGGYFPSLIHKEPINDIDIFIPSDLNSILSKAGYIRFEQILANLESERKIKLKSSNIIAYQNPSLEKVINIVDTPYQIIFSKMIRREEVIAHFDYKHCTISFQNQNLYLTESAYRAAKNKILVPHNSEKIQQYRKNKFLDRGYKDEKDVEKAKALLTAVEKKKIEEKELEELLVEFSTDDWGAQTTSTSNPYTQAVTDKFI